MQRGHATPVEKGRDPNEEKANAIAFPFTRDGNTVNATIEFRIRSLDSIFTFLGQLLRADLAGMDTIRLYTSPVSKLDTRLATFIAKSSSSGCFAYAVDDDGGGVCVPSASTENTKAVFALVSELTQLSLSPSDIPTSLTVKLTP